MRIDEAERGIRHLCGTWRKAAGLEGTANSELSFTDFLGWIHRHHPEYLSFRSTMGVEYMVELWFDQEFKQTWRN